MITDYDPLQAFVLPPLTIYKTSLDNHPEYRSLNFHWWNGLHKLSYLQVTAMLTNVHKQMLFVMNSTKCVPLNELKNYIGHFKFFLESETV